VARCVESPPIDLKTSAGGVGDRLGIDEKDSSLVSRHHEWVQYEGEVILEIERVGQVQNRAWLSLRRKGSRQHAIYCHEVPEELKPNDPETSTVVELEVGEGLLGTILGADPKLRADGALSH